MRPLFAVLTAIRPATVRRHQTGQNIKFTMTEERENKVLVVESADAVDGSHFRPIIVDLTVLYPIVDPNKAGAVAPPQSMLTRRTAPTTIT